MSIVIAEAASLTSSPKFVTLIRPDGELYWHV